MHFTNLLALLLTTSTLASANSWFAGRSQKSLEEDPHPVPGDNPLIFCADPGDYLLKVDKLDLTPNPPKAGKTLSLTGQGKLKKDIEKGAKIHIKVKYGLLQILNQEADLCDYSSQVDLNCPLEKGDLKLKKDIDLPSAIPPGTYTVSADVYTKDGETITCINAAVTFSTTGAATVEDL